MENLSGLFVVAKPIIINFLEAQFFCTCHRLNHSLTHNATFSFSDHISVGYISMVISNGWRISPLVCRVTIGSVFF